MQLSVNARAMVHPCRQIVALEPDELDVSGRALAMQSGHCKNEKQSANTS